MTVGERIRALREEKDMSLAEVARQIGIGRSTLYKYETGAIRNIPPDNIHALANFFGVMRPYLMGWTDERNINPAKNLDMVAERMRMAPDGSTLRENAEYWKTPCSSGADCMTAATQAYRALVKYGIGRTPIYPQQIIQISRIATMISLADPAELKIIEQNTKLPAFRMDSDIVMTSMHVGTDGDRHYLFAFNREAPIGKVRMALAAELGHIYMGHSEHSRNTEVRKQEAACFANHLEFPRPMIRLLQEHGFQFTRRTFSRIFGDCEWCLDNILRSRPISVSPELNRLVKEQFTPYVKALDETGILSVPVPDDAEILDFSNYMAGYEE